MQEVRILKVSVSKQHVYAEESIKIIAAAATIVKEPINERLSFRLKGGKIKV